VRRTTLWWEQRRRGLLLGFLVSKACPLLLFSGSLFTTNKSYLCDFNYNFQTNNEIFIPVENKNIFYMFKIIHTSKILM
jgi:hypothetical protein